MGVFVLSCCCPLKGLMFLVGVLWWERINSLCSFENLSEEREVTSERPKNKTDEYYFKSTSIALRTQGFTLTSTFR